MNLPEYERVIYERNPLIQVVCQLRFPTILKIAHQEPVEFQDEIRFQYPLFECDLEQEGLPELTADFKKVFGIDSASLYNQIAIGTAKRRSILESPYLEHFSRIYNSFHGKVALPSQYESEKEG